MFAKTVERDFVVPVQRKSRGNKMKTFENGKCAVCEESAIQSCAHCGTISYCGKEHQKEHWSSHRTVCKPYRVEQSDVIGRYMVASREIKAGELIIKETPMIVGPRMDSVVLCLGCYKTASHTKAETRLCSKCNTAPICCAACEIKSHHAGSECDAFSRFLKGLPHAVPLSSLMEIVMPFRCLLMRSESNTESDNWKNFLEMESHTIERENTPIWQHNQEKIINVLQAAGVITTVEDQYLLHKICGILDVNSFELRGPNPALMTNSTRQGERLRGVYMEAALMSHDCLGNTHLAVDDDYTMSVHASNTISAGEPILFNYASTLESTPERLYRLKEGKYFVCKCKRCTDPTELGTYMGSIFCSRCHEGLVIPDNPLMRENAPHSWRCEKCCHKFHPRLINTTITQAWLEIEDADNTDSKALEVLLKRFSRTFPQSSVVMVEIKQNLIALYRDIILREPNPVRKVLQRKMTLCLELLKVLNIVEPGISRLRGITLYELHSPMVFLANREYDSGEITVEALLNRLHECESILKDAVSMLLYEPCNSPEGRLLRVAIDQLRILRQNIQEVKLLCEIKAVEEERKKRSGKKVKKGGAN